MFCQDRENLGKGGILLLISVGLWLDQDCGLLALDESQDALPVEGSGRFHGGGN